MPATNNECERALRPSVIFRKVAGGFRSQWVPAPMPTLYPSSQQGGCTDIPLSTPSVTPLPAALSSFHRDQG